MAEKVVLESGVDQRLIRDLKDVADGLRRTREEGERLAELRGSPALDALPSRVERIGRAAQVFNEVRVAALSTTQAIAGTARALAENAAAHDQTQRAIAGLRGGFDGITRSTNGTVTALAAYRAQQTLVNSGLRVSGEELALVARHAREHRDVTKSAEEAVQELTEALRGGEAEGLRKYGLSVQQGATRAQTFERALRQMRRETEGVSPAARTASEDLSRFNESMSMGARAFGGFVDHALGLRSAMNDLGESIRGVANDMTELIERESQLPQNRAQAQAHGRAASAFTDAQRGLRNSLRSAGFSDEEARSLIPTTALGRLTPEQVQAQARRLATLREQLVELSGGQGAGLSVGADPTATTDLAGVAQIGGARVGQLGEVDARAALAGLRAARGGRGNNAAREQIRTLLRGIATEMAGDATANQTRPGTTRPGTTGPRDTAATPQSGATALDAQLAQVESEIAVMAGLSANERDGRFGNSGEAQSRLSILQEQQVALIQRIARTSRVGENDNAQAMRAAAAVQRIAELRAQQRAPLDAEARLLVEKEEANRLATQEYQREQAVRRTVAEQDAFSRSPEGRAEARRNALRGLRQDAFSSRESGRRGSEAALADLRDPAVQGEMERDRALSTQVERERAQAEERLRVQESFADQWERLHRRQASATTAFTESATGAIGKFGEALGKHINLVVAGQETIGEGVLNMVQEVVTGIGQEAIVKSAMEFAEGVAAAAGVFTAPLAPGHFAAAAAFGAVGVAAIGAGALIGAARGGGGGGKSAPVASPALPPPTQAESDASAGGRHITIVYGAGILGSTRDLARHIRDVMEEGEQGGVRLSARVVERAA